MSKCWIASKINLRKVLEYLRGKNVELLPKKISEITWKVIEAILLNCGRQVLRMFWKFFEAKLLTCVSDKLRKFLWKIPRQECWNAYLNFWECARRISQRKCSNRAKREIRKVRQENQGKNVEMQPRQVLRMFYRISGAKKMKCSWKILGVIETKFEAKMSNWGQDEFRKVLNYFRGIFADLRLLKVLKIF